jgi:dipeptidyl aminopeptidase/acylaminoacyl peptidase
LRRIDGFVFAATCALACAVLVFAIGAVAGEAAMHPPRLTVPAACPAIEGAKCSAVEIRGGDGVRLRGWFFMPRVPNGGAVIALHGVAASRVQTTGLARLFLASGYAVLTPDLRGHGESGGIASYGALEADDVHRWADWVFRSPGTSRLYGMGGSLGGSVILQSLDREPRFRAVIAESAYSDFPAIERVARWLPSGARWLTEPVVWSGLAWTRWRYGIDLRRTSSTDAVRKTRVPVLLIHGLADNRTSPENSRRIAGGNRSAALWLVPGAGHTEVWATSPREFESRVPGWFAVH